MPRERRSGAGWREVVRRIRKPVPPPGHAFPDERDRLREEEARREVEEALEGGPGGDRPEDRPPRDEPAEEDQP